MVGALLRTRLPALTGFVFRGEIKYLEDLVARIDMPSVEKVEIECFPPWLDVPQLSQFIDRTASLKLAQFRHAEVTFGDYCSQITLDRPQLNVNIVNSASRSLVCNS